MRNLIFIIIVIACLSINTYGYSGGSGTAAEPYQIATALDLKNLGSNPSDYDANFILTADIDLSSDSFTEAVIAADTDNHAWTFDGDAFTGVFDGKGHTIRNLFINTSVNTSTTDNDYLGLFGKIDTGGVVKNLRVENVIITAGDESVCIGGIAGLNYKGLILRCCSTGSITAGTFSDTIGGLAGWNYGGEISQCYSSVNIAARSSLGGLLGCNDHYGLINNCFATGNVSGQDNSSSIGGLVGDNYTSEIINCYSIGNVTSGANSDEIGGLVGISSGSGASIDSSYFLSGSGPNNGNGTQLIQYMMKRPVYFTGWDFAGDSGEGIWCINVDVSYPALCWELPAIEVTKCKVKAGNKDKSDKLLISGTLDVSQSTFTNGVGTDKVVKIYVGSEDKRTAFKCSIDDNQNLRKYKCYATDNTGRKMIFKHDILKGKFSLIASNLDLSGFSCPLTCDVAICNYMGGTDIDEEVVNGKKPIPMSFLMGFKNSLRVDKIKVKRGKTDQLMVKGGFSAENKNLNMSAGEFSANVSKQLWSSVSFTIPAGNFKAVKDKFIYSGPTTEGYSAKAKFDFKKCTFTLIFKDFKLLMDPGSTRFSMEFGDFDQRVNVDLP